MAIAYRSIRKDFLKSIAVSEICVFQIQCSRCVEELLTIYGLLLNVETLRYESSVLHVGVILALDRSILTLRIELLKCVNHLIREIEKTHDEILEELGIITYFFSLTYIILM